MSVSKAIGSQPVIAYNACYAKFKGSDHTCALFLSQVLYWCSRSSTGWIWLTHDSLEDQTGMGRKSQDRACAYWVSMGIMKKELRGIPAKINYFVDFQALDALLVTSLVVPNGQAVMSETDKLSIEDYIENTIISEQVDKPVKTPPHDCKQAEELYAAYPRRVGKLNALKAIRKALTLTSFDDLLMKVKKFADSSKEADIQFIPYPATWFNQGRWMDELKSERKATTLNASQTTSNLDIFGRNL